MDLTSKSIGSYKPFKMSWLDRISLIFMFVMVLLVYGSAMFLFGADWMSDVDYYASQVTAK